MPACGGSSLRERACEAANLLPGVFVAPTVAVTPAVGVAGAAVGVGATWVGVGVGGTDVGVAVGA